MARVLYAALLAVFPLLVVSAAALSVREVSFTAGMNWSGPVALRLPSSLFEGATGLYVSNVSDCSVILPTWYQTTNDYVLIVYDPGENMTAGQRYTWYLCYGDVVVPVAEDLALCSLPGSCNATVLENGATLHDTNVTVHGGNTRQTAAGDLRDPEWSSSHSFTLLDETVYVETLDAWFVTDVEQSYTVSLLGVSAAAELEGHADNDTRVSYDTGLAYYDTGVVKVYDAGRRVNVHDGYITINVYDSDRDTFTVYLYIDGVEVARWSNTFTVNYSLAGRQLQTIAVRVYDSEENDYVRATGEVRVIERLYNYTASLGPGSWGRPVLAIEASDAFPVLDGGYSLRYYEAREACGNITFLEEQPVLVLRRLGADAEVTNYTVGSGYAYVLARPPAGSAKAVAGAEAETLGYTEPLYLAYTPYSVDLETETAGTSVSDDYPEETQHASIQICIRYGPPGGYGVEFARLVFFSALTDIRDVFVGSEQQAGAASSGAGAAASNTTVIVTGDTRLPLIAASAGSGALAIAGVLLSYYSILRRRLEPLIAAMLSFGFAATTLNLAGLYDTAYTVLLAGAAIVTIAFISTVLFRTRRRWP